VRRASRRHRGLGQASHSFLRGYVLDHGTDPPDVLERIADPPCALTERVSARLRDRPSAGGDGACHRGVRVPHEHAQQRRHVRPAGALVERQQDRVPDPDLGMADAPVLERYPPQFIAVERGRDEVQ
jgi:hypothetical protein